ncbi:hypothetical protein GIB67_020238, partial [Kingdonia uniflora]
GKDSLTLSICYTPPTLSPLHLNRHLTCPLSSPSFPLNSPSLPCGKKKYKNKKKLFFFSLHSTHSVSLTHSVRQDSNSNFSGFFVPSFVAGTPSPTESLSR